MTDTPFETVIGIEVHAQLKTRSKLFCSCPTTFGAAPNTNVCPICLGMPGVLPVLNERAVDMAIMAGLAAHCTIQPKSVFARKNYFYPDLPKGYQISQYDQPICTQGYLEITRPSGDTFTVRLNRIHMEEDAGKLVHQGADAIAGATGSLVDLNRAAMPLIEIVTEPDIHSPEDARLYIETLREILVFLGICDGNMEEGSLRADANISLRPRGSTGLGTKTEVKNMNSFRSIERAIHSEILRQTDVLLSGGTIRQETRHYDDATHTTRSMRSKEESHDYRYFPDPDLQPLLVSPERVASLKCTLPELPEQKRLRYQHLGISENDSRILMTDKGMIDYFEAILSSAPRLSPALIAKWVVGDLCALVNQGKTSFSLTDGYAITYLEQLLTALSADKVSTKMAKDLLIQSVAEGSAPNDIIAKTGASMISDTTELSAIIDRLLQDNPDIVEKVKSGKAQAANVLVGQVMKATRGQAKPDLVMQLITDAISALG